MMATDATFCHTGRFVLVDNIFIRFTCFPLIAVSVKVPSLHVHMT